MRGGLILPMGDWRAKTGSALNDTGIPLPDARRHVSGAPEDIASENRGAAAIGEHEFL
jgi:hypothetical protein